MAKCTVTLVLLLCLALENNSIFSRLHARSQPSGREVETALIRQQQHHHQQQLQKTTASHHAKRHVAQHEEPPLEMQRHERHVYKRARSRESKPNESEEDKAANRRYYARLRRHLAHQRAHLAQQEHNYHHATSSRTRVPLEELRTMPRIWQHLIDVDYEDVLLNDEDDEDMFGDDPAPQMDQTLSLDPLQRAYTAELLPAAADEIVANKLEDEIPPPINPIENNVLEEIATHLNGATKEEPSNDLTETKPVAEAVATPEHKTAVNGCPKCESKQQVEQITEEELTRLRIEFVKQQILEKLRLKERPNVSAVGLPKPISEGVTIEPQEDGSKSKEFDDYYARTSKKFIFLKREKRECQRLDARPSMCFSFKIDDADADGFDVNTAVLWLFKNKQNRAKRLNETHLAQQTIVVSEVQQQLNSEYLPVAKTIAIQTVDVQDEWMKIDIEWPIKRWFGDHDLSHLIQITCESCDIESMDEMISVDKDYRPFIMVDTQNRRRQMRAKRSINCSSGVTECCRDKLYISFDEIGWGDWIIQPRGYDAYFCRGSCGTVASVTQSSSHHSSFLARVLSTKRGQKPLELIPCCTAKQYSSLQLVFMDSNNTATQKTFPNMVVESCGCR